MELFQDRIRIYIDSLGDKQVEDMFGKAGINSKLWEMLQEWDDLQVEMRTLILKGVKTGIDNITKQQDILFQEFVRTID